MYHVSSKTGKRHVVEADEPDNEAAVRMFLGHDLPTARCGLQVEPVNIYRPDDNPTGDLRPACQCSRCFA